MSRGWRGYFNGKMWLYLGFEVSLEEPSLSESRWSKSPSSHSFCPKYILFIAEFLTWGTHYFLSTQDQLSNWKMCLKKEEKVTVCPFSVGILAGSKTIFKTIFAFILKFFVLFFSLPHTIPHPCPRYPGWYWGEASSKTWTSGFGYKHVWPTLDYWPLLEKSLLLLWLLCGELVKWTHRLIGAEFCCWSNVWWAVRSLRTRHHVSLFLSLRSSWVELLTSKFLKPAGWLHTFCCMWELLSIND